MRAVHPGPVSVALPAAIRTAIRAHARSDYPNEACGIVIGTAAAADGGRAVRFEPTRNAAASPLRYEIDPADLFRLTFATDDADEVFWAIVHSHVRSPARRRRPTSALPSIPTRCTSSCRWPTRSGSRAPASRASAPGGSSTARSTRWS